MKCVDDEEGEEGREGERESDVIKFVHLSGSIQGAHFVQASFEKKRSGAKGHKRLSGQSLTQNHGKQPLSSQF